MILGQQAQRIKQRAAPKGRIARKVERTTSPKRAMGSDSGSFGSTPPKRSQRSGRASCCPDPCPGSRVHSKSYGNEVWAPSSESLYTLYNTITNHLQIVAHSSQSFKEAKGSYQGIIGNSWDRSGCLSFRLGSVSLPL